MPPSSKCGTLSNTAIGLPVDLVCLKLSITSAAVPSSCTILRSTRPTAVTAVLQVSCESFHAVHRRHKFAEQSTKI